MRREPGSAFTIPCGVFGEVIIRNSGEPALVGHGGMSLQRFWRRS